MKLIPILFNMANSLSIRSVTIKGDPWFVGRDIAAALGYKNANQAMADQVDDEDKQTMTIDLTSAQATPTRKGRKSQDMVIINESGLYGLILGSSLPSAKEFKRWVTKEVLPTIRKSGGYVEGVTGHLDPALEKAIYDQLRISTDSVVKMNDKLDRCGFYSKRQQEMIQDFIATEFNLSPLVVRQMIDNPSSFKKSLPN